jgi:hypothetical protein
MTLEQFTEQYKKALETATAAYGKIHLKEVRTAPNGQTVKREWWMNGDDIKAIITTPTSGTLMEFVRRTNSLKLHRKTDDQPWVYQESLPLVHEKAYQHQRNHLLTMTPEALRQPFRIDPRHTLAEVLKIKPQTPAPAAADGPTLAADGATKPEKKKPEPSFRAKATKVETLGTGDDVKYRVHFQYLNVDQVRAHSYVDVDPKLSWLVTKGWAKSPEASQARVWTIEYGPPVNGVPVMKQYTSNVVNVDEKTGAETPVKGMTTTVAVEFAEPYEKVNETEFTAAHFKVEEPQLYNPFQSNEMPRELYYVLGGVVAFVVLVLGIHFTRRRTRKDDAATPAPTAPLS